MKTSILFLCAGIVHAAPIARAPMAGLAFDVVPGAGHPASPAELAWLDDGRVSAVAATGPEGEAILSAPHFQIAFGGVRSGVRDPFRTDSLVDHRQDTRLRLGTALALSQVGLGSESFDLSLGGAYERDRIRLVDAGLSGSRQWLDASAMLKAGAWRLGGTLVEAVEIGSDPGLPSGRRLELEVGRLVPDDLAWGAGLDLPLRTGGEVGVRLGLSRGFRQALDFQGQLSTSYARATDPADGKERMVRRSLELRLGTRLKFRPWVATDDPAWIRNLVDPAPGLSDGDFLLRGWEIGVSAGWDLVSGQARPAFELARAF